MPKLSKLITDVAARSQNNACQITVDKTGPTTVHLILEGGLARVSGPTLVETL